MKKRIILKTVLVCLGIFLILTSAGIYFFSSRYELDTEKKHRVVIAVVDIPVGSVITDEMVAYKTIKESGYNTYMLQNSGQAVGMKALYPILKDDFIPAYDLLSPDKWYKEEDRAITLPMDVEGRLANLIKKGSLIDIKVELKDKIAPPQTVLSRVFVEEILDENGLSLGENIGSKKAYAKVVLDNTQRDRLYVAAQYGKLLYELYCDNTQKPSEENFMIPSYVPKEPLDAVVRSPETTQDKASEKEGTP